MRSMSDEKLSSRPPSLPIASTSSGIGLPSAASGRPIRSSNDRSASRTAAVMSSSARSDSCCSDAHRSSSPARDRHRIRISPLFRRLRSIGRTARVSSTSALVLCAEVGAGRPSRIAPQNQPQSRCRLAAANSLLATSRVSVVAQPGWVAKQSGNWCPALVHLSSQPSNGACSKAGSDSAWRRRMSLPVSVIDTSLPDRSGVSGGGGLRLVG